MMRRDHARMKSWRETKSRQALIINRFVRDESGMTMGLAVIMIVLIGVMGAGLLTFVSRDLSGVVEVNQGQRAFEMADAGVQAAKSRLSSYPDPRLYDGSSAGGITDSAWYGVDGTSGGTTLNMDGNSATVKIQDISTGGTTSYKVISEGQAGQSRRKIEAIVQRDPAMSIPRAYFTRGSLLLTGSASLSGVSFFALIDARREGAASISGNDDYWGKWAETSGSGPYPNSNGSYPNDFNRTPRASGLAGVGALGTISGFSELGTRNFGSTTTPRTVQDYGASSLPNNQKIAFPFEIATPDQDKQSIEKLRQRALKLEKDSPGTAYYIDSNPGNGVDDAGMPNRSAGSPLAVASWYPTSDYETVRFYEFQTYNSNNTVNFTGSSSPASCDASPTSSPRGVIVVQNGDFLYNGNKAFHGGVVVRAYDSSGNLLSPPSLASPYDSEANYRNGSFRGEGTPCLKGYANASGNTKISGNITPGPTPELSSLSSFSEKMQTLSWRELYQ